MLRIQYMRELFLMDVESGVEVLIPQELSQKKLPHSFRYYDPILNIV